MELTGSEGADAISISPDTVVTAAPPSWQPAVFNPEPLLMWSTTNRVVHEICTHYFPSYYVWCSPVFDGEAVGRYDKGYMQASSSDPASIYRSMFDAVRKRDEHNADVGRQRKTLERIAGKLFGEGKISEQSAQEVITFVQNAHISEWQPIIYAIPYYKVKGRVLLVSRKDRAGKSREYVIEDLSVDEFQPIEPMICA